MWTKYTYNMNEFIEKLSLKFSIKVPVPNFLDDIKVIVYSHSSSDSSDVIEISKVVDYLDRSTIDILNNLKIFRKLLQKLLCACTLMDRTPEVYIIVKANKRLKKNSNLDLFSKLRIDNIKVDFN